MYEQQLHPLPPDVWGDPPTEAFLPLYGQAPTTVPPTVAPPTMSPSAPQGPQEF